MRKMDLTAEEINALRYLAKIEDQESVELYNMPFFDGRAMLHEKGLVELNRYLKFAVITRSGWEQLALHLLPELLEAKSGPNTDIEDDLMQRVQKLEEFMSSVMRYSPDEVQRQNDAIDIEFKLQAELMRQMAQSAARIAKVAD